MRRDSFEGRKKTRDWITSQCDRMCAMQEWNLQASRLRFVNRTHQEFLETQEVSKNKGARSPATKQRTQEDAQSREESNDIKTWINGEPGESDEGTKRWQREQEKHDRTARDLPISLCYRCLYTDISMYFHHACKKRFFKAFLIVQRYDIACWKLISIQFSFSPPHLSSNFSHKY